MDEVVKKSRGRPRKDGVERINLRVDAETNLKKIFLEEKMDLNTSELVRFLINEQYKKLKNYE